MSTVAEFTVPAGSFPLGTVFDRHPEAIVELDRVVPTDTGIIPYLWIHGPGEIEEAELRSFVDGCPEARSVDLKDVVDGACLVHVEWDPIPPGALDAFVETGVVLLSGRGTAREWTFHVRADRHQEVADFQRYCRENDLPVELTAVYPLPELPTEGGYDLTAKQREALLLAYERGYFRSPRAVTLEEMATEFGITGQSLGSRIRRGIHRLVGSALVGSSR